MAVGHWFKVLWSWGCCRTAMSCAACCWSWLLGCRTVMDRCQGFWRLVQGPQVFIIEASLVDA
ncbi:hypothetical protein BU23DRAFT_40901 [Bimuria novae-zelandiae CBS 107.79]|uniref:Uncharacterized protein n=1 Tax=Bimuria novae-zelandiae CBS 107.79 TaxID=1447943 RepID=A0A6A5UIY7_9PLEO|nr:hypothetical protein BU23DRAFT_40901 [Bimuria novae-zelandiae CBS 107.79]